MEKLQHVRTGAGDGPLEENQKEWPEREEADQGNRVAGSRQGHRAPPAAERSRVMWTSNSDLGQRGRGGGDRGQRSDADT